MKFSFSLDPVRSCAVYKVIGCTHVDGFLCDMPTCDMLAKFDLNEFARASVAEQRKMIEG